MRIVWIDKENSDARYKETCIIHLDGDSSRVEGYGQDKIDALLLALEDAQSKERYFHFLSEEIVRLIQIERKENK